MNQDFIIMNEEIKAYHIKQAVADEAICNRLAEVICAVLPHAESKLTEGHPVWYDNGNPLVGYTTLKEGVKLQFWSGQTFEEVILKPTGDFKEAEILYSSIYQIDMYNLQRWVVKAREIQWDYKNVVEGKGQLERLK